MTTSWCSTGTSTKPTNACHELIPESTKVLIEKASQAGCVRADVTAADALIVVTGIVLASGDDASSQDSERLVRYFVDGITTPSVLAADDALESHSHKRPMDEKKCCRLPCWQMLAHEFWWL